MDIVLLALAYLIKIGPQVTCKYTHNHILQSISRILEYLLVQAGAIKKKASQNYKRQGNFGTFYWLDELLWSVALIGIL